MKIAAAVKQTAMVKMKTWEIDQGPICLARHQAATQILTAVKGTQAMSHQKATKKIQQKKVLTISNRLCLVETFEAIFPL